jgi:hypothetical protein
LESAERESNSSSSSVRRESASANPAASKKRWNVGDLPLRLATRGKTVDEIEVQRAGSSGPVAGNVGWRSSSDCAATTRGSVRAAAAKSAGRRRNPRELARCNSFREHSAAMIGRGRLLRVYYIFSGATGASCAANTARNFVSWEDAAKKPRRQRRRRRRTTRRGR